VTYSACRHFHFDFHFTQPANMNTNLTTSGTWADLLAALQKLTPEQLSRYMVASSESSHYADVALQVTTEKHYQDDPHDPYLPESEMLEHLTREELAECDSEDAGAVFLFLG
jgi:hypothetical protein